MVVVSGLVAKFEADTSDLQRGVQEVKQSTEAVSRALEVMAEKYAKAYGGTATEALAMFRRAGVEPTAAALAEVQKQADAAEQSLSKTAATAKASAESIASALRSIGVGANTNQVQGILTAQGRADQQSGIAKALESAGVSASVARKEAGGLASELDRTQKSGKGLVDTLGLTEGGIVRAGGALVGVGLGLSLAAGLASKIHETVIAIVNSQLGWEQSLKSLSGAYGAVGTQIAGVAQAQANLPNVLGTQQEFARAQLSATDLRLRYGLSPDAVTNVISTGGRIAFATGMRNEQDRTQLQQQLLEAVRTGAPLPSQYPIYVDPESVARRLGRSSGNALAPYTDQQLQEARAAIINEGGTQYAQRAEADQRIKLEAATAAEKTLERAGDTVQNALEGTTRTVVVGGRSAVAVQNGRQVVRPAPTQPSANIAGLSAIDAEQAALTASQRYVVALQDNTKIQEASRRTFEELNRRAEAAASRLSDFAGALTDLTSIGHGDLLAQSQAAVAGRARSAVPAAGMGPAEIRAVAANTGWQQAWQNYVAQLAQEQGSNPIRENLERLANVQGPGLEGTRAAAGRALAQGPQLEALDARMGTAQRASELVDIRSAGTQAGLQQIALTQQERYVQLLRDTVDLRKLDVQQQQAGLMATMEVVRAQQSAQPALNRLSDANYTTERAGVLARAYMARAIQGKSVAGLPSIEQLTQMNVRGQLEAAAAGPDALEANRRIELAGRGATAANLAQQLTEGQVRYRELGTDLKNLGDVPAQAALMLEGVQNARDSLSVQKEMRDGVLKLIEIMGGKPGATSGSGGSALDELINRVADAILGEPASSTGPVNVAPPEAAGARRGPS